MPESQRILAYETLPVRRGPRPLFVVSSAGVVFLLAWIILFLRGHYDSSVDVDLGVAPVSMDFGSQLMWALPGAVVISGLLTPIPLVGFFLARWRRRRWPRD